MDSIVQIFLVFALIVMPSCDGTTMTALPGDDKVIQWTMDPVPPSSATVQVLHPSGDTLLTALGDLVLPADTGLGDRITNTDNTNTSTGHIEFTLTGVTVQDAGDYKTRYSTKGSTLITATGVTLVVYGKPSTPTITAVSPPVIGGNMNLSCVTQSNSKPDNHESLRMIYIWQRNGADLPSEDRYVTSGSWLQVKNIQRSDRDTVFTCKAYETVSLTSNVSAGYIVVVQYGPDTVSLAPPKSSYSLVENRDTLGPITCSVDCVPDCTYQWKFNDADYEDGGATLTINNIQRTAAGTYDCEASNTHGTKKSQSVIMAVLYGPVMTSISPRDSSYTRVEVASNSLGPITCSADCNPGCSFQWFRDGQVVSSSAELTLTGITRINKGTYSCKAFNAHGGMNSTSVDLIVEYGPDPIVLAPATPSYTLREDVGSLNEVTCTSQCNPECSYSWERGGNPVSSRQVLSSINNIKRGQAGQYMCKVSNKHGNRETSITVVVQYIPDKPVLIINRNNVDVIENAPISFQCTTQSVPPSMMVIYRKEMTTLYTADNTNNITHTIPQAGCLDTGLFSCSAENVVGKSNSDEKNVNVLCKPRSDHRVPQERKHALGSGDSMNISGTLISNPLPTIYWSMRLNESALSTNLTNNTDTFVFHNHQKTLTVVTSQAVKTKMDQNDFGEYLLNAYNDYGKTTIVFTVTPRRKPDAPILLEIVCESERPVQITFAPNFDGGDRQKFNIGRKLASDPIFTEIGDSYFDDKQKEITLTGPKIDAGIMYIFTIIARNTYGKTESTSHLNCSIEIIAVDKGGQSSTLGPMVGGIVGGLVLAGLIGFAVFYMKRRQDNSEKSK